MLHNNAGCVSVLMAAHNEQDSIEASIQSILNQSIDTWELIIVDDFSKDRTTEILKKYSSRYPDKIHVYRNSANLGLAVSLNKGARFCKYKYIARFDADDLCKPYRFHRQVSFLEFHPEIALVSGAIEYIDEAGITFGRTYPITLPEKIRERILSGSNIVVHPAVMMRKDAFQACGGYCDALTTSQDLHLWTKFLRKGYQLSMVPEVMICYRITGKAISNRKKTLKQIELMRDILEYDIPPSELINAFQKEILKNKNQFISREDRKADVLNTVHCRIWNVGNKLKISEKIIERIVCFIQNRFL